MNVELGSHSIHAEPSLMPDIEIKPLSASPEILAMLSEMLIEAVANGGSVSFMHPLPPETAHAFWENSLAAAARGERIVLGAFDRKQLVGTVTLVLDLAPNQPHRAEVAKMLTRISHRGRGVATALLRRAESMALERARTLLVLDTAADGGASALYEGCGFKLAGVIPDYSLKPHGGLTDVRIYWKQPEATPAR
jgi:ribosomal protein S18 acetylase RimI-like enzyme